jgi:hypothetical protein
MESYMYMDLLTIKANVKACNYLLESNVDYFNYIY